MHSEKKTVKKVKTAVPGGNDALKLAKAFLSKMKRTRHSNKQGSKAGPADRKGMLALFGKRTAPKKAAKSVTPKHLLTADDTKQIEMQKEMAKRTEAATHKQSKARQQKSASKGEDISHLFGSHQPSPPPKKEIEGILRLNGHDKQALHLQKQFTQAQLTRQQLAESKSPAVAHSRNGVSQLFHGKRVKPTTTAHKKTSEVNRMEKDFDQQKNPAEHPAAHESAAQATAGA